MPSERQLVANRNNAQKSTGPKTPEGRAAVSLNGVKHGLTAATLVLPGEKESDFQSLLDSFEAEHHPETPTEEALVRQLAMAQWRLRRLYHVEAAFFRLRLTDLEGELDEDYNNLDPIGQLALVAYRDLGNSSTLDNLSRLESRLERSFYKALHELQRLGVERPEKTENQTHFQDRTPPPKPQIIPFPIDRPEPVPDLPGAVTAPFVKRAKANRSRDRQRRPGANTSASDQSFSCCY